MLDFIETWDHVHHTHFALLWGEKRGARHSGGLRGLCDLALASPFWELLFPQAVPGFLAFPSLLTASVSSLTPWVVNLGYGVPWRTAAVLKVAGTLMSQ